MELLSDSIKKEYIQLRVSAKNREEAVRKAAEPLLVDGCITNQYIQKIIEIMKETGPYIVITKAVALPHAPSKYGANKLGIGITTLEQPVVFGNEVNDPVSYLFCLSAPDSDSHLESTAELVGLLDNERFYKILDNAKDPEEILQFIKEEEQKGENEHA